MKIKFLLSIICVSISLYQINLQAQEICPDEKLDELMLKASIVNSSMLWDRAINLTLINYKASNTSKDLLELCYAYYGKLGNCLSKQDREEGIAIIEKGLAAAEKLSQDFEHESVAYALLAGFNGMSIAFSPMKGMFLGPESDKQIEKSLDLDPNNAIGWLQKGSSQYNTPRIFGGSVDKSVDSFKKSIKCFEKDDSTPIWMKLEAMIWLGQAYYYKEEYQSAKDIFISVLNIAPSHQWVEQSLLPAALAKLN